MNTTWSAHFWEPHFPSQLREVKPIPDCIEAEGALATQLETLSPAVAVVGTRTPPIEAERFAYELGQTLARAGIVVISGGAFGIDAAAHQGALDAGGRSIAVLPGGVDVLTPRSHRSMFHQILKQGALVAIRPRGTTPRPGYFLQRNGVIAALADQVILVAAPMKSGARSTAAHARRMQKPLWVVPASPWEPLLAGAVAELKLGARPLQSSTCILEALNIKQPDLHTVRHQNNTHPIKVAASLTEKLSSMYSEGVPNEISTLARLLEEKPKNIDELAIETGIKVARLRALLLTWMVEGMVSEGPAGVFHVRNSSRFIVRI